MEITITLSLEELNGVMAALGNMPYVQAAPLVDKIRNQAAPQLKATESGDTVAK